MKIINNVPCNKYFHRNW